MRKPMNRRHWLWRLAKGLLVVVVLVAVTWTFYQNFQLVEWAALDWQPEWLVLSGASYFLALSCCAVFWWLALRAQGQRPGFFLAFRAYHVSHLGKYAPGKALGPFIRTLLVRGPGVQTSVALVTVFYETLTVMGVGAIVGALWLPGWLTGLRQVLLLILLLGLGAFFLSPPVFNRLSARVAARFQSPGAEPPRPLGAGVLLLGIALGAVNLLFLGLGLLAAIQAVQETPADLRLVVECTGVVALATVLGFVTPAPGGLGVREWLIAEMLGPQLGPGPATIVAILLRLTGIVTELLVAGVLYPAPLVFSEKARHSAVGPN
jgi:hypothetical protein